MNLFKKLFTKSSNINEDYYEENEVKKNDSGDFSLPIVIKYIQEENKAPEIVKLTEFHHSIMPDIGSIIWVYDKSIKSLRPYKVIRYDFIEENEETYNKLYIVVQNAGPSDVLQNYEY